MVTVTVTKPQRRRPRFHELRVVGVERLTDDAVAVAFAVPHDLRDVFAFRAGQHVTVRRFVDGTEHRRSYSICSPPSELALRGRFRIGVREVRGGIFSAYANTALAAGETVEVLAPLGSFTSAFDPGRGRHYVAIAAGSGITPVLSLVATALETEPRSRFTLVYANRTTRSVMFADELAGCKDRWPDRLHVVHVLSREPQLSELTSGRLDPPRLGRLFASLVPPSTVDEWFLCGPYGLVDTVKQVLAEVAPGAKVHSELFHVESEPPRRSVGPDDDTGAATVTIRLDGRTSTFPVRRGERILDRAREERSEVPYSCTGGVCGTCRAKLVDGRVDMPRNYALEPDELAAGYILTCQSTPVTDHLTVDYDA